MKQSSGRVAAPIRCQAKRLSSRLRPLFEAADFGKEFTPELRAQEERLREEIERQQQTR